MTSDGRERKSQASFLPKPFPWDEVIGFGLGTLRLAPDVFWRMTVRELGHALKAVHGHHVAPLARSDLAALMARFPDAVPRAQSSMEWCSADPDRSFLSPLPGGER